jgi:hypothetical protein
MNHGDFLLFPCQKKISNRERERETRMNIPGYWIRMKCRFVSSDYLTIVCGPNSIDSFPGGDKEKLAFYSKRMIGTTNGSVISNVRSVHSVYTRIVITDAKKTKVLMIEGEHREGARARERVREKISIEERRRRRRRIREKSQCEHRRRQRRKIHEKKL